MMLKKIPVLVITMLLASTAGAQNTCIVKVLDAANKKPLEAANLFVGNKLMNTTNKHGLASLQLPLGQISIQITSAGYNDKYRQIAPPCVDTIVVMLSEIQKELDEITIVSSTRNNQNIESSPLKVEILGHEDMEEESTVKPAGIASILGDVSGVQIQQSSAVTGNANVRIQGLDGRYTQILKDGMPLYDGFSGGFGILSIPPLDLKQVELVKGSASTLYGGGAIGGLINIISKKPTTEQEAVVCINQTTLKETNVNTYVSKRYKYMGYAFFGGYNAQKAVDVNHDGFSDVPALNGLIVHPRLFFYPDERTIISTGYTGTFENRKGGDMQVLAGHSDTTHQFFEENKTLRNSFELMAQRYVWNNMKLDFKSSLSAFDRTISNNDLRFTGRQLTYYTELSLLLPYTKNNLVAGINVNGDQFKKITQNIPLNDFKNQCIGLFLQNTWNIKERTIIEAGLRNDYQLVYGNFLLPRLAIFHRLNEHWATRAGVGFGYKIPNALAQQTTDYSIQAIQPLPTDIQAEQSIGYNAEGNYKTTWGHDNQLFINQAFFLTQIDNPVVANVISDEHVIFSNQSKSVVTKGSDTYIRTVVSNWELYVGYTFTIAERTYLSQNQFVPLTPKNRFAFTVVRDFETKGFRMGMEGSYTGQQYREDHTPTPGYLFIAAMMEKKIGTHWSVVLNGENLLNYKQSNVEALYTGTVAQPVFNPLWAPIDGIVLNLSVKWKL